MNFFNGNLIEWWGYNNYVLSCKWNIVLCKYNFYLKIVYKYNIYLINMFCKWIIYNIIK